MNNNSNLDENIMNNIKNMVDNGNISEAISQISPEMIQNFSKLMQNSNQASTNDVNSQSTNTSNNSTNKTTSNSTNSNLNFSNLDMETIMKISSAMSQINEKNDPRANLLYSLKPYLRDEKKKKIDQYANLLNISKIADIMKNNQKGE